ncbi:hypothetical protein GW17_00029151 [Ensete ventricosum]|nr:hypothetical protein GW17_00029151 [Ensete ventricosum]RZR88085.1 hypothetical protein BHM03_00015596 [Ensete ventricosum]
MHYQRRRVGELDDARLKFEMNTMLPREAHPSVSSWLTWVLDMAKRRRKFGQRPLCQWKPGLGSGWTSRLTEIFLATRSPLGCWDILW